MNMKRKYRIKLYTCKNYENGVDKYMLAKRYSYKVVELATIKFSHERIATIGALTFFATLSILFTFVY